MLSERRIGGNRRGKPRPDALQLTGRACMQRGKDRPGGLLALGLQHKNLKRSRAMRGVYFRIYNQNEGKITSWRVIRTQGGKLSEGLSDR